MDHLNTQPRFGEPGQSYLNAYTPGDDFYQALIDTHRDLSDEQSRLVNARLILLLANHIGDLRVLREAMAAARAGVTTDASTPAPRAERQAAPGRPAVPLGARATHPPGEGQP